MKIVIDPGHGGSDSGAVGSGLRESDIVLDVALKAGSKLQKAGVDVIFTRNDDKKVTLEERTSLANAQKADYFVSIHANAGGGTGVETLIYKEGSVAGNLAKIIQEYIVNALGLKDRKVKARPDLWVLRKTNMPAVLIELAFIDNPSDAEVLKNSKDEFANAIAAAILKFIGKGDVEMPKFKDVPDFHWAKDVIEEISDLGIMKGFADGTFKHDEPLSRAQAAVLVKNLIDYLNNKK